MKWTLHLDGGPRRVNHAAVSLNNGQQIFSFGGYTSGENFDIRRPLDVHILDCYTYRWSALPVPSSVFDEQYSSTPYQRYGHTAVEYKNSVFLWGGRNDGDGGCDLLFRFDPSSSDGPWSNVKCKGAPPPKRDGHSACTYGDSMLVFGGYEEEFQRFSNETYFFDFRNSQWCQIMTKNSSPSWRDFHTATVIGTRMYVFGGRSDYLGQFLSNREIYDDKLRYLDLSDNSWHIAPVLLDPDSPSHMENRRGEALPVIKPQGRRSHSTWEYNGDLYVFGGYNGHTKEHYNDLHRFNVGLNRWQRLSPFGEGPKPRRRQCCVPIGSRVLLFGGTSPKNGTVYSEDDEGSFEQNLVDHSDMYILDMKPTLKTLCLTSLVENGFHSRPDAMCMLPLGLRTDVAAMTTPNKLTTSRLNSSG